MNDDNLFSLFASLLYLLGGGVAVGTIIMIGE